MRYQDRWRLNQFQSIVHGAMFRALRKTPRSFGDRVGENLALVLLATFLLLLGLLSIFVAGSDPNGPGIYIALAIFGVYVGICAYYAGRYQGFEKAWRGVAQ